MFELISIVYSSKFKILTSEVSKISSYIIDVMTSGGNFSAV